jgi:hypothetical protein
LSKLRIVRDGACCSVGRFKIYVLQVCPTWGKVYRNSHFGKHFATKNLKVDFLNGFKSLRGKGSQVKHHPRRPSAMVLSETPLLARASSSRLRGLCGDCGANRYHAVSLDECGRT